MDEVPAGLTIQRTVTAFTSELEANAAFEIAEALARIALFVIEL